MEGPADLPAPAASRPVHGRERLAGLLVRGFLHVLAATIYRVRVIGGDRMPRTGAVLLTPNHVSFVDALFLLAATRRPIRFVVEERYYRHALLRPFMRALRCVPVSAAGGPRAVLRALRDAGAALDRGEVVCIFPEGQLTRTGTLLPFRRGMSRMVKGRDASIVPVYMEGVWGSVFSRERGRYFLKWPKRLPYRVTIAFGDPLPPGTSVERVRQAVQDVSVEAWAARRSERPPLHHTARRTLRRRFRRLALVDSVRGEVSGIGALTGAVAIARALRADWRGQERVGILLPPSVAGVLVNVAAAFAGRVSVNLNFTSGREAMESAVRQAGLRTVVSSQRFLEKAKVELPQGVTPIWVDDLRGRIGTGARLWAATLALLAPIRLLERACGAERRTTVDDDLTVIFSSGSTGEPKGALLTHFNVDCNVEAAVQVLRLEPGDRLLGILPLFHSFGNLLTWFSVNHGVPLVLQVSPLDANAVGAIAERHHATILVATPTFLQLYARRCAPGQFGSLRVVIAGAEKLTPRVRDSFHEAFGIEPLEGYGTTECAPVVCTSVPDFRAPGLFQPGSRRGSVGQPLPGVAVRIVDPDTFEPLPPGTQGMLLVRGPNVMRGYLGRDDLTASALRDGWYVTGDIASVDDDGFLRITDRLARFSKIGGEMVPHGRVEEALHEAAGQAGGQTGAQAGEQVFAVTAVADPRKGERLAVLHTTDPASLDGVLARMGEMGLPNLFLPRRADFVRVDALPILGTGKLDLRAVKRIANEALSGGDDSARAAGE